MKRIGIILTLALLVLANGFAAKNEDDCKIIKTFDQQYDVPDGAKLELSAVFGDVNIVEWDKNQIDFHIEVKANNKSAMADSKLMQKYENVLTVKFNKLGKTVSCAATFKSPENNNKNVDITITYLIKVPKDIYMDLTSRYGNITVKDVMNPIEVDVKFANFSADKLLGNSNSISVQYGSIGIEEAINANIVVKFGSSQIDNIQTLELETAYSSNDIAKVQDISLTSSFGSVDVEEVTNITGTSKYDKIKINNLINSLDLSNLAFGSLKIDTVNIDFSKIVITAKYSPIKIKIPENYSYNANLRTSYGKIKLNSNINSSGDDRNCVYTGKVGTAENPKGFININNSFSDIILTK